MTRDVPDEIDGQRLLKPCVCRACLGSDTIVSIDVSSRTGSGTPTHAWVDLPTGIRKGSVTAIFKGDVIEGTDGIVIKSSLSNGSDDSVSRTIHRSHCQNWAFTGLG